MHTFLRICGRKRRYDTRTAAEQVVARLQGVYRPNSRRLAAACRSSLLMATDTRV
jgi:hypothetical protein